MNLRLFWSRSKSSDEDRALLEHIERVIAEPAERPADHPPQHRIMGLLSAARPQIDAAFQERLEGRLIHTVERNSSDRPRQNATVQRYTWRWAEQLRARLSLSTVFVLLFSFVGCAAVTGVVLGQVSPGRISPTMHDAQPTVTRSILPTRPPSPRWMDLEQMRQDLAAPLLLPGYLPPGCIETERFSFRTRIAYLNYSCVSIRQFVGQTEARPEVPADAIEWVTISGQPALYIDGGWSYEIRPDGTTVPTGWRRGSDQQLLFVWQDRLIAISNIAGGLTKEELIRIAESLR